MKIKNYLIIAILFIFTSGIAKQLLAENTTKPKALELVKFNKTNQLLMNLLKRDSRFNHCGVKELINLELNANIYTPSKSNTLLIRENFGKELIVIPKYLLITNKF